jgi:hypothetical protein
MGCRQYDLPPAFDVSGTYPFPDLELTALPAAKCGPDRPLGSRPHATTARPASAAVRRCPILIVKPSGARCCGALRLRVVRDRS